MYMAVIQGWTEVRAFSRSKEKAKKMALAKKRELCYEDDVDSWGWERISEYYGAYVEEVKEGTILY